MRALADIVKDDRSVDNLIVVELLVAQVIAAAAYKGKRFSDLSEINVAVVEVAGYPMLNRFSDGTDLGERAARRIAGIVGIKVD